jgi:hypothetical protein
MSDQSSKSEIEALAAAGEKVLSSSASVFQPLEQILAGARMGSAITQFIFITLLLIARAIITPCELLLRQRFGERYFSALIYFVLIVISVFLMSLGHAPSALGVCLIIIASTGMNINFVRCFLRDRKGQYWHSYSDGDSFIRFHKGEEWLARYFFNIDLSKQILEPLLLLLISGILFLITMESNYYSPLECFLENIFGFYFLITGIASFLYHCYAAQLRRAATLDKKDTQIMLMVENEATNTAPEQPLKLHHVAGVAFLPAAPAKKEA